MTLVHAVTTFTPIVISIAVFVVALLQWRLAREKLRLDLYNRRWAIFSSVYDFYNALLGWSGSESNQAARSRFFQATVEARFLFSDKSGVADVLDRLHKASFKVIGFHDHGRGVQSDREVWLKWFNESQAIMLKTFDLELVNFKKAVKPYLRFDRA